MHYSLFGEYIPKREPDVFIGRDYATGKSGKAILWAAAGILRCVLLRECYIKYLAFSRDAVPLTTCIECTHGGFITAVEF